MRIFVKHLVALFLVAFLGLTLTAKAQPGYNPTPENKQARERFQDHKLGIFLHWGLYSMLATGEWTMTNKNLNYKEYAKLAGGFYPAKFNAHDWVKAIKEAGAGYICFTTRHHEGFSMWDTKLSDYSITRATPFKRDVLKELAQACEQEGIDLHCYYSLIDWYREDFPWGRTGRGTGRPNEKGDWQSYLSFMEGQLQELLTQYGKVGAIWFDGWWDHPADFNWEFPRLYSLIHKLQPACLVGNNHHTTPFEGEDIQIFERDLPGENKAGLSGQGISHLPLETCQTMNGMWGYKMEDLNYKSTKELIHYLVRTAGKDANLLLNIGPQPDGELPVQALERLKQLGEWMKQYGPTIKGTRGGVVAPHPWGVTTQRGKTLFVHVLDCPDAALFLPLPNHVKVKQARLYKNNQKVSYKAVPGGVLLVLPSERDEIDTIIQLDLK